MIQLLCLLLSWFGVSSAQKISYVNVPEGEDALLNCTLNFDENIKFDWRKDNRKIEVFEYKSGSHPGNFQDEQFENRVVFFQHELQTGNASIIIKNTRLEDNGTYTCGLLKENREEINIRLNIVGVLKTRPDIPGAARLPHIQTIHDEITWRLLQCSVKGVPNSEVEWRNSAGRELRRRVPESEFGHPLVELQLNVTKSDKYTCLATQRGINHRINNTIQVSIPDVVAVSEGDNAVLPCSLNMNIKSMVFSWKRGDKELFLYNKSQVEKDTLRLTHFQQELESGNASIKIHNTEKSDSGHYTCNFPTIQKSHVILQVVETSNLWMMICGILGILLLFAIFVIVGLLVKPHCKKKKKRQDIF